MTKRKPVKKKSTSMQTAFTRFMLIIALLILWIGGIGVRLVHLQVSQHEWLREKALDQRQDVKRSRMLRGTIYDRNDRALAMSLRVKTLYADPTEMGDLDSSAKKISAVLKINKNQILEQLTEGKAAARRFVPLARKLDGEAVQRINKALKETELKKSDLPNFAGLHWREDQKRSYPNQTLAAHIIGFADSDDTGQAGLEKSQNDILHGAVIKKLQERDRLGRIYDETVFQREAPKNVVLTISNSIQYKTEQALERGAKAANAKSAMAIVLNTKTGEVLALANYPSFDPNNINEATPEELTNRAIQTVYSPGSVFKLVTYGSALEKKLITPDGEIDSGNGTIEIAKHKFTDSHAIGRVTYAKALAHSSNVCAIKTGMRVGKEDFYSMVKKLGFGQRTGIEMPAESPGIVRPPEKWYGDSLASMSIGYEIGVSALQMTSAFATIANDGIKIQPHIIKEIRESDETVISVAQPEKTQVVTAETARSLRKMLRQVVTDGTAKRAQLDGYTSAGKTGTAWKFNPKTKSVDPSKYISSFIGFAPAENSEITVGVVMDEPSGGARDGGQVSAPVFREIAQSVLEELGIKRDAGSGIENKKGDDIPEAVASGNGTLLNAVAATQNDEPAKKKTGNEEAEKRVERSADTAKTKLVQEKRPPAAIKEKEPDKNLEDTTNPADKPKMDAKNKSSTEKAKGKT